MLKTTLVVSTMHGGGTERVVSHMANYWAAMGWPVTILTLFHGHESSCYALDSRVVHDDLRFSRARRAMPHPGTLRALKPTFDRCSAPERRLLLADLHLLAALRQAIRRTEPEIVISFIDGTNVRVLLAVEGLGLPVIVSERSDPWRNVLDEGVRRLRRRMYPKASYLVAQADDMAAYFPEMGDRRRTIPNPVVRPAVPPPARRGRLPDAGRVVVGMGRLADEKGFTLLMRAFAKLAPRHPSWSLDIWGIGPLRPVLERLGRHLQLNGRLRLPGFTRRPADVFARADLFVLSSISEGFPNVLGEAMACGLPAVSFECSSVIRQIIRHGIDGVIVPSIDVGSLSESLDRLMSSEAERTRLSVRAVEVVDRFAIDKAMAQWEALAYASARSRVRRP